MKYLLPLVLILLCLPTEAQQNSFAIVVDEQTHAACQKELEDYARCLRDEGLHAEIVSRHWETPEQVRAALEQMYRRQSLEGAVFIGDIPVVMVRRAQHLTSAFKMDENRDWFESSVPSDRFYDDFDLQFDFLHRDSLHTRFFYYNLSGESRQEIACDIYSGRIKPSLKGEAGYGQIRAYLRKAVAAHRDSNPLDCIVSYTGSGSFSNSLAAWKDEGITLREQCPAAFTRAGNAKLLIFYMQDYPKKVLIDELRRKEIDLFLFHEHGTPDRQYLSGFPVADDPDRQYEQARMQIRSLLRNLRAKHQKDSSDRAFAAEITRMQKELGVDSTWFQDWDDPKFLIRDSLADVLTGIVLEDIPQIQPQPKIVVFDACYNGDFREEDFIANRYIFSPGSGTLACFANSVNVLQDKSSTDLMGLLSEGYRVGEWTRCIHILESHVIGDPTFAFTGTGTGRKVDYYNDTNEYWMQCLRNPELSPSLHSLSLYRLYEREYPGLDSLLAAIYRSSPYYTQRLQCMHLLAHYRGPAYPALLKEATRDTYEFIRRKALYYMGRVGDEDLIPYEVEAYLNDAYSERIQFNIQYSSLLFDYDSLRSCFEHAVEAAPNLYDKAALKKKIRSFLEYNHGLFRSIKDCIVNTGEKSRGRRLYLSMLRNNPIPALMPLLIERMQDSEEDPELRIAFTEALGWYTRCAQRESICTACSKLLEDKTTDPLLRDEVSKTANRIKAYQR